MRSILLSIVFLFALSSIAEAQFLTLNDIGEASCRVRVSNAAGSGTSISQDETHIYVLTNAHVVGNARSATCEFFRYGRKTGLIPGEVIWKSYSDRTVNDFAIIKLKKSHFGKYPPRIVPMAPIDHPVKQNDYIASAGCPQARWLQLWEGHALSDASQNRVLFTPPPLGGQSGSGVYTIIDGNTYLVAVLTWRIGDGGEEKGGAIHIGNFLRASKGQASTKDFETVPANWQHIFTETQQKAQTKMTPVKPQGTSKRVTGYYALGSDGLYYRQTYKNGTWYQEVTMPYGVKVVKWNVKLTQDCPDGICPPIINPNRPPIDNNPNPLPGEDGNPFGMLPPNWGGDDGGPNAEKNKKIKELEEIIAGLNKQIADLKSERDGLAAGATDLNKLIKDKENAIAGLNQQVENLKKSGESSASQINDLEERIDGMQNDIAGLNLTLNLSNNQIRNLEESLNKKSGVLNDLMDDYDNLTGEAQEVKSQRNLFAWLFGGTSGGGLLLWFVTWYWKLRGKRKVKGMIDDKIDPESIADSINDKIDRVEEERLGKNHALEGVIDFLQEKLEIVIEDKINGLKEALDSKLDDIEVKASRDVDVRVYNQIDDKDTIEIDNDEGDKIPVMKSKSAKKALDNQTEEDFVNPCDELLDLIRSQSFPPASDRIKEFIDLKRSDGERVEELAFYAHLYKEAVGLLKDNRLVTSREGKPFKVSNQSKAAEAIESHVQTQFLRTVSSATINRHILYHEAMIGFLYRQAVTKLKRGEFNVLGYKEIANVIEKWVKKEFLTRMGFSF